MRKEGIEKLEVEIKGREGGRVSRKRVLWKENRRELWRRGWRKEEEERRVEIIGRTGKGRVSLKSKSWGNKRVKRWEISSK